MLNFSEADLFMRAGQDVRFAEWPAGDFLRRPEMVPPHEIAGYEIRQWEPSTYERGEPKWRIA